MHCLKSTQYQEVSGLAQHWGRRLGWSGPWQQKRQKRWEMTEDATSNKENKHLDLFDCA